MSRTGMHPRLERSLNSLEPVGVVSDIRRYPVKSMLGESLEAGKVGWHGVQGDRQLAFLLLKDRSGLPWLSGRECPAVLRYRAVVVAAQPRGEPTRVDVITPSGRAVDVGSDELRCELQELMSDAPMKLVRLWRGTFDAMPLSIITSRSIATVASAVGGDLGAERFRANLVIESSVDRPYPEEKWCGRRLVIGDAGVRLRVDRRTRRCSIINWTPGTNAEDSRILRHVASERRNNLGVYASVERTGDIREGDVVYLERG